MLLKFNEHSTKSDIDEYFKLIERDCKPFLTLLRKHDNLKNWYLRDYKPILFRGLDRSDDFLDKQVRKNRIQKDSFEFVDQEVVDHIFFEKFGVKPRSQGLFSTFNYYQAERYGNVYAIFPKGDFDYIVGECEDFLDFWNEYVEEEGLERGEKIPIDHIKYVVGSLHHKNSHFGNAIKYGHEIMFLCDSYYAIRMENSINFRKLIESKIHD